MEKRELTCIGCPMGCLVTVELDGGKILSVTGHTCKRGEIYARKEVTDPTRIVTSTVRVEGGVKERVSCKTREDIPKDKIADVMKDINRVTVKAPIKIGDILIENAASTGVPIVATANVQEA
ncbi:MAG: DUF1667 domain-containing protein [Ruminococcus sp.]|nr:DUF1667 domain-containing protein [Ruminococcus sp.]